MEDVREITVHIRADHIHHRVSRKSILLGDHGFHLDDHTTDTAPTGNPYQPRATPWVTHPHIPIEG